MAVPNKRSDPRIGVAITSFAIGSLEIEHMTTATVPAPVVVAPVPVVMLVDLPTAQLSELLNKLAERHDVLKESVTEFNSVKTELAATLTEFQKRLGNSVQAPSPKQKDGEKRPRAKKDSNAKSLKELVLLVLEKNPAGLELKGIVAEVQGMINRNEYTSNAKSLSAVVSQAVNALKQEEFIKHDRDTKIYFHAGKAA